MAEKLRSWKIDIAILPIHGCDPKRGAAGNLSGNKAVALARDIEAALAIPCHYEMFEFNTVSPDAFVAAAKDMAQKYRLLNCWEHLSL